MIDATTIHPHHYDIQTNHIDYVCPEWLLCIERFMITAPSPFQPDSLVGVKYSDEHRFFFPWQKRTDLSATKTISPSCAHGNANELIGLEAFLETFMPASQAYVFLCPTFLQTLLVGPMTNRKCSPYIGPFGPLSQPKASRPQSRAKHAPAASAKRLFLDVKLEKIG